MASIAIADLGKSFGATKVLDGVALDIPDGKFAVFVGPSGCGKSTLLRLIAGLERPTSGTIRFGERDVTNLAPRERDIAMVFQSYALYPHLTVRENLAFGLRLRKASDAEIAERVAEASRMLGLEKLLERMPRELSGGQRQRVAMGRAVVRRAQAYLFDEPLSNLDAALRAQVRVEIRKLHESLGATSVYVTHDQVEAMTLADVMFVLNKGKVEQSGAPLAIYDRPKTRFVAGFLGSPAMNFLDGELEEKEGSWSVALGDGKTKIALAAAALGAALVRGRRVTAGIRPHDLVPIDGEAHGADSAQPLELDVTFAEALGGETYAHGTLAGSSAVVRLDARVPVGGLRRLALSAPPSLVHVFDRDTGESLRC